MATEFDTKPMKLKKDKKRALDGVSDDDAKAAKKARKAAKAAKKAADLATSVKDQAAAVKSLWESLVLKESQALEAAAKAKAAAAEKEKALKAEREKSAGAGAKRDASAILATAAKRTKIDAGKNPVAATKIGAAAVARPTTTTTIVRPASSSAKSSGLSFGGINIRGAGFQPERPAGLVKPAAKAKAPSPPPTPMLYKKRPSKRAAAGVRSAKSRRTKPRNGATPVPVPTCAKTTCHGWVADRAHTSESKPSNHPRRSRGVDATRCRRGARPFHVARAAARRLPGRAD